MITAPYMNFHGWMMKDSYQDATDKERRGTDVPHDFGAIDAPATVPAGSHIAYRYSTGGWTWLPKSASR